MKITSDWRLGGYQGYLKAQVIYDRAAIQTQAAGYILRETQNAHPANLKQACAQIALLHYFDTLLKHGKQCARDSLQKNPAKYITLINACRNTANTTLALEKRRHKLASISRPHLHEFALSCFHEFTCL